MTTKPKHHDLAAPFDRLASTRAYARRLADDTGIARVIVRCHPESPAALIGMRFGIMTEDEIEAGDNVVERHFAGGIMVRE